MSDKAALAQSYESWAINAGLLHCCKTRSVQSVEEEESTTRVTSNVVLCNVWLGGDHMAKSGIVTECRVGFTSKQE